MASAEASPALKAENLVPGKCYHVLKDGKDELISGVCLQGGPAAGGRWEIDMFGGNSESFSFIEIDCTPAAKKAILQEFETQFLYEDRRDGKNGHITFKQALAAGLTKEEIIDFIEDIPTSDVPHPEQYTYMKIDAFLAPLKALAGGKRRKSHKRVKRNRKQRQQRSTRK